MLCEKPYYGINIAFPLIAIFILLMNNERHFFLDNYNRLSYKKLDHDEGLSKRFRPEVMPLFYYLCSSLCCRSFIKTICDISFLNSEEKATLFGIINFSSLLCLMR